jgi:hypothetical protein
MAVRRRRAPEPIASTLGSIIDRRDSEGHFAIVRLVQTRPEIVGETIARRTEVVELISKGLAACAVVATTRGASRAIDGVGAAEFRPQDRNADATARRASRPLVPSRVP